jgi:hypothetical protein
MNDFPTAPAAPDVSGHATASLFLWRGAGIVLCGMQEDERWVLARGWLEGDRLEHVRRWSFAQPIPFSGQVRRLVHDATRDASLAGHEGLRALAWAEAVSR